MYGKSEKLFFGDSMKNKIISTTTSLHKRNDSVQYQSEILFSVKNIMPIVFTIISLILFFNQFNLGAAHSTEFLQNVPVSQNNLPVTDEFSRYTIIQPKIYHGRHKRAIQSTLEKDGSHASQITISYTHNGNEVLADLNLNHKLIPAGHFLRYQLPGGGKMVKNLTKSEIDLCHYQGVIRGVKNSIVALSTCDGIKGLVFDGLKTYHILAGRDGKLHSDHFLYDNDDYIENGKSCGVDSHDKLNQKHSHFNSISDYGQLLRHKRSTMPDPLVRGPYNSNSDSSYVELVLVIDNKVYKSMDENIKAVYKHSKDLANIINSLYVPLNIFVTLVGVVVWTENNEVELSSDGDKTLKNFLHYRKKVLIKDHPNDNAQLLTKETFEGGVVGKALKGTICTYEYSGGVSMNHSPVMTVVATTMAHEMGHNFGMEHDSDDCKCPEDRCIMSASSSVKSPTHWSSCSIDQLNFAFHHGMNYCLKNKPVILLDTPSCGNGIVEAGEQCDCGLPTICDNTCCNPSTCMLYANASCATGECCDLSTCRPRQSGYECRKASGECDLPEYCTGESEYCPKDVYKRDTETCGDEKAYCYQGQCKSHNDQCKLLWGTSGKSSEQCYTLNTNGSSFGNCGYNKMTDVYKPCAREDILCGMLHCRHLNEKLEFGMESVSILAHSFINDDRNIIPCRTAIVDLGMDTVDPGLTPDGAKCGDNKMCVDQRCVSINDIRETGKGIQCKDNCNGNGVCNSQGHCHCFLGFAPPSCLEPGAGGSIHSGPASNIKQNSGFVRVMLIFFLGVIPTMSLVAFGIFYWRTNKLLFVRKTNNVFTSNNHTTFRGAPSPPNQPASTPSSPDDMNSALLKTAVETKESAMLNNHMFGKFKGFTMKPLPKDTGPSLTTSNVAYVHPVTKIEDPHNVVPVRPAPSPPKHQNDVRIQQPAIIEHTDSTKSNTLRSNFMNSVNNTAVAPALPPYNVGTNPRPIISSPILEASTCSAKELSSPLNKNPMRRAPTPPVPVHGINASTRSSPAKSTVSFENEKKEHHKSIEGFGSGTLKRIQSFLKKDDSGDNNQNQPKKLTIDREKLKNIEISAPIPQFDTEAIDGDADIVGGLGVNRTQSMRDSNPVAKKRTNIQSFGSMRQPSTLKRPKSFVGQRPKIPPPPRPPAPTVAASGYQNPPPPKKVFNDYDACEAVEPNLSHISEENSPVDNIYAVIDEVPSSHPDDGSLLGEIVNEIEKKNAGSIYSASTLKRNKRNERSPDQCYENTQNINDDSENEYANVTQKSTSSTTSSGYLRPSAINAPIARVTPTKVEPPTAFSSFKSTDNRAAVPINRNNNIISNPVTVAAANKIKTVEDPKSTEGTGSSRPSPYSSFNKKDEKPATKDKVPTSRPSFNRTVTPPNLTKKANSLRSRSPSPKHNPILNKSNSTVQETSVNRKNSNVTKPKPLQKPSNLTTSRTADNTATVDDKTKRPKWQTTPSNPITKSVDLSKVINGNKNDNETTTAAKKINSNRTATTTTNNPKLSHVASIQQKFENGNGPKVSKTVKK